MEAAQSPAVAHSAPHLPAFIHTRKVGMLSMTGLGCKVAGGEEG